MTEIPPILNEIEIRVAGLRRSGLHAVINWLAGLYSGPICFLNDVNHREPLSEGEPCSDLASIPHARRVSAKAPKQLLIYNYEECSLAQVRRMPSLETVLGKSRLRREVLVLRDPYNMLSSRIALVRRDPMNEWTRSLLMEEAGGIRRVLALWREVAQEYLSQIASPEPNVITVNYNQWLLDFAYRKSVAKRLGITLTHDMHRDAVNGYGFGSSFDGVEFDGRGSKMELLQRWRALKRDELFISAFRGDSELHHLASQIFGAIASQIGFCLIALQRRAMLQSHSGKSLPPEPITILSDPHQHSICFPARVDIGATITDEFAR